MTILSLLITAAFAVFGYVNARHFVRVKLRYVDAVQKGTAPLMAGGAVGLVAWVIPFVAFPVAAVLGISVALGVAAGAKDIRNGNAGLIEP